MANFVHRMLDIILSPEYRDVVDSCGNPVIPSSDIYQKISTELSKYNTVSPKYVYTILKRNRYETWDKVLKYHNIGKQNDSLTDSSINETLENSRSLGEREFTLTFTHKVWVIIDPERVQYSDKQLTERGYTLLQRKVWTDTLYEQLWVQYKIQCPISFKKNSISESGIYLKVCGQCNECGCLFSGLVVNKPQANEDVRMECLLENYDEHFKHSKKRQLKGKRRIDISSAMIERNIFPCIWRRNEAKKVMKFGDPEPAHLPKNVVLRKAKQERHAINLGLKGTDLMENIQQLKYEHHAGEIHAIGLDPFFVHYWTQEQMAIYILNSQYICIDGTGSLVRKLTKPNGEQSSHVYLYQIMTETPESKVPVFQMLSTSQNTNTIHYWLNEIVRIGSEHKAQFPLPKQVTSDFDKALLGACARTFAKCHDLKDYLSKCYNVLLGQSETLPASFLRLDVSHYVKMIARWKELKILNPLVKKFFIMAMALLIKIEDFEQFKQIVKSMIIILSSPTFGMDENGCLTIAEKSFRHVHHLIKGDGTVKAIAELAEQIDEGKSEDRDDDEASPQNIFQWVSSFYQTIVEEASSDAVEKGEAVNPYYAPHVGTRIKSLLQYFPLYSGVLKPYFKYGSTVASSSAVESEFNDLKHRQLIHERRPMRIDKFVSIHLKSFSGRTKIAAAEKRLANESTTNNSNESIIRPIVSEAAMDTSEMTTPVSDENLESHELAIEHNWRNKNAPKKLKRTYLDSCPELKIATSHQKKKIGISILQNGNLCESIRDVDKRIVVTNTCGFDSIIHILAAATVQEQFETVIKNASSEIFKFVGVFTEKGSCKQLYRDRANILRKIPCFVRDGNAPGIVIIDAVSNATNLCEMVFKDEPSCIKQKVCTQCKFIETRQQVTVPLHFDTIREHGYEKLNDAIMVGNSATSKAKCTKCNGATNINIEYRSHVFVECIEDANAQFQIKCFPKNISFNDSAYELVGIVDYQGGRTVRSVGHYTACVKYGDTWIRIDDLTAKTRRITAEQTINPTICVYVKN